MEQIRQLEADSERYTTIDKAKGLPGVKNFLMTQSAKIVGYDIEENIPQATHTKVMSGEINTHQKLLDSINEEMSFDKPIDNIYTYILQEVKNEIRLDCIYIIDSIFIE